MPESGQTWCRHFKGLPEEARHVREWAARHLAHEDAPLIADELFAAVLGSIVERRPAVVEMTISTAGARARISASGPAPLPAHQSHGPGAQVVARLATSSGTSTDRHSLWALITMEAHP